MCIESNRSAQCHSEKTGLLQPTLFFTLSPVFPLQCYLYLLYLKTTEFQVSHHHCCGHTICLPVATSIWWNYIILLHICGSLIHGVIGQRNASSCPGHDCSLVFWSWHNRVFEVFPCLWSWTKGTYISCWFHKFVKIKWHPGENFLKLLPPSE